MGVHEKNNDMIEWIDMFKAICIVLMVMGHAGSPFTTYIYLFHMPAFILISGYTYSGDKYRTIVYLKRKITSLLIPMLSINVVYILFYVLMQKVNLYLLFQDGDPIGFADRAKVFFRWGGTPDLGGATWFIFVLFTVEVLFKLINNIIEKIKIRNLDLIISLIISVLGWYFIKSQKHLLYSFDLSLFAMFYFSFGVFLKRFKNIKNYVDEKLMIIIFSIITLFFGGFYFANQLPMNWPTRQFASSLIIQLISSLAPIYLCYVLSKILQNSYMVKKALLFIGKKTYIILIFHFVAFKMIFGLFVMINIYPIDYLKELVPRYSNTLQWLFITIVSILICLFVSWLSEKNLVLNYILNAKIKKYKKR